MAKQDMGTRNYLMFVVNEGWTRIPIHVPDPVDFAQRHNAATVKQRHSATNETVIWTTKKGILV